MTSARLLRLANRPAWFCWGAARTASDDRPQRGYRAHRTLPRVAGASGQESGGLVGRRVAPGADDLWVDGGLRAPAWTAGDWHQPSYRVVTWPMSRRWTRTRTENSGGSPRCLRRTLQLVGAIARRLGVPVISEPLQRDGVPGKIAREPNGEGPGIQGNVLCR